MYVEIRQLAIGLFWHNRLKPYN